MTNMGKNFGPGGKSLATKVLKARRARAVISGSGYCVALDMSEATLSGTTDFVVMRVVGDSVPIQFIQHFNILIL
jgi:hypothetical protein